MLEMHWRLCDAVKQQQTCCDMKQQTWIIHEVLTFKSKGPWSWIYHRILRQPEGTKMYFFFLIYSFTLEISTLHETRRPIKSKCNPKFSSSESSSRSPSLEPCGWALGFKRGDIHLWDRCEFFITYVDDRVITTQRTAERRHRGPVFTSECYYRQQSSSVLVTKILWT